MWIILNVYKVKKNACFHIIIKTTHVSNKKSFHFHYVKRLILFIKKIMRELIFWIVYYAVIH